MPEEGLEPSRDCSHSDLNAACLPISPSGLSQIASLYCHKFLKITSAVKENLGLNLRDSALLRADAVIDNQESFQPLGAKSWNHDSFLANGTIRGQQHNQVKFQE